jgi:hypothetical protein
MLDIVASLFNPDDFQNQNTFQVKRISRPPVPNNKDHLQVFKNDEQVAYFLANTDESLNDHASISKNCINFESIFTRDDQIKMPNLKEKHLPERCKKLKK